MQPISFFADGTDVNTLLNRLNADPEIAFIAPDGPLDPEVAYANRIQKTTRDWTKPTSFTFYGSYGLVEDGFRQRWKAVRTVERLKDGNHKLWHIPAGPLPLLAEDGPDRDIHDPWEGWTERRSGADPTTPYFGAGHPAEIRLELWTRDHPYSKEEKAIASYADLLLGQRAESFWRSVTYSGAVDGTPQVCRKRLIRKRLWKS